MRKIDMNFIAQVEVNQIKKVVRSVFRKRRYPEQRQEGLSLNFELE